MKVVHLVHSLPFMSNFKSRYLYTISNQTEKKKKKREGGKAECKSFIIYTLMKGSESRTGKSSSVVQARVSLWHRDAVKELRSCEGVCEIVERRDSWL